MRFLAWLTAGLFVAIGATGVIAPETLIATGRRIASSGMP